MSKVLLINKDDILQYSSLNGNIDFDKIKAHIFNAQIIYLEPLLGSNLYQKIIDIVETDTINTAGNEYYKTLLLDYITPVLVFSTLEIFTSFHAYEISNSGITKFTPENATAVEKNEVDYVVQRYRLTAEKYAHKMEIYLDNNADHFTELSSAEDEIEKNDPSYFTGWNLA
jgi:hypothetical protein